MWVYIIEAKNHEGRRYVGLSEQPRLRLAQHNKGEVKHTARLRPYILVATIWFANSTAARQFEIYLKSGSGAAFHRRYFLPPD